MEENGIVNDETIMSKEEFADYILKNYPFKENTNTSLPNFRNPEFNEEFPEAKLITSPTWHRFNNPFWDKDTWDIYIENAYTVYKCNIKIYDRIKKAMTFKNETDYIDSDVRQLIKKIEVNTPEIENKKKEMSLILKDFSDTVDKYVGSKFVEDAFVVGFLGIFFSVSGVSLDVILKTLVGVVVYSFAFTGVAHVIIGLLVGMTRASAISTQAFKIVVDSILMKFDKKRLEHLAGEDIFDILEEREKAIENMNIYVEFEENENSQVNKR